MSSLGQNRSLSIIIAGAGIAGVTAAVALRQAGHTVHLLEKSSFANPEVGAAINVTPNGARVLRRLGFDFERALAYRVTGYEFVRGENLENLKIVNNVPKIEPGTWAVHRADLHAELMRLARDVHDETESSSWGPPVDLRLGAKVQGVVSRDDGASVILEDGKTVSAHLVVGADGGNSVVRSYVLGGSADEVKPVHSGMAAFRFLIETDKLKADKELEPWLERTIGTVTLLVDVATTAKERHIIWYGCHGNELQNFVGIHPSETKIIEESDELKGAMMQEYSHFDASIKKMIGMASHLKRWPLYVHEPISTWVRGRVVLIGDAVHPMLPFGAQGANMAIEDGAALGLLLKGSGEIDIADSLAKFEKLRKNRAARVQILSSVRAGREIEVQEQLTKYLDSDITKPPTTNPERCIHDWGYDVLAEGEKLLKRQVI